MIEIGTEILHIFQGRAEQDEHGAHTSGAAGEGEDVVCAAAYMRGVIDDVRVSSCCRGTMQRDDHPHPLRSLKPPPSSPTASPSAREPHSPPHS